MITYDPDFKMTSSGIKLHVFLMKPDIQEINSINLLSSVHINIAWPVPYAFVTKT